MKVTMLLMFQVMAGVNDHEIDHYIGIINIVPKPSFANGKLPYPHARRKGRMALFETLQLSCLSLIQETCIIIISFQNSSQVMP